VRTKSYLMMFLIPLALAAGPLGAAAGETATPPVYSSRQAADAGQTRVVQQKRRCFRKCTNVRVCRQVPTQVCRLQRYCQPRRQCTSSRVGNQIVRRCQSICQWLTRRVCQYIRRLQCRMQPRCQTVCIAVRG